MEKREAIDMSNDQNKIVSASASEPTRGQFEELFNHPLFSAVRDVSPDDPMPPPKAGPSLSSWAICPPLRRIAACAAAALVPVTSSS